MTTDSFLCVPRLGRKQVIGSLFDGGRPGGELEMLTNDGNKEQEYCAGLGTCDFFSGEVGAQWPTLPRAPPRLCFPLLWSALRKFQDISRVSSWRTFDLPRKKTHQI